MSEHLSPEGLSPAGLATMEKLRKGIKSRKLAIAIKKYKRHENKRRGIFENFTIEKIRSGRH